MNSKVYITQENPKLNYTPALKFGDLKVVTQHDWSIIPASTINRALVHQISTVVDEYRPDLDYVLMSGDPIIFAMIYHAIMTKHRAINLLKWDGRNEKYYVKIHIGAQ